MNITETYNFKTPDELISCSGTLKNINIKSLSDEGYDVIINLLPDDGKHVRKGEKDECSRSGIQYFYIPVKWEYPKKSDFQEFEKALNSVKGKRVHIHCAANYRASAFYAVYSYRNKGWSKTRVNEFIGTIWKIVDYPIWDEFVKNITNQVKS